MLPSRSRRARSHLWAFVALSLSTSTGLFGACATSGETCSFNSDCLRGYCSDGTCKQDCVDSAKDCPKGYVCNAIGQCEFGSGGGAPSGGSGEGGAGASGGAPSTGGSPSNGGAGPTTTTTDVTTTSSMGGAPPGGDAILTLCSSDGSCDSGMCRPTRVGSAQKRCTQSCSSNAQCASGFRCETIGAESYCAASDVGKPCTGTGQCNFACLSPLNYCTSACSSGADCPNGYGCMFVAGSNVCVRVEADCAADTSQCVSASACDTSLVVSGCTFGCTSAAECPQRALGLPTWTCDGACRRPADVYGPLPGGYAPAQWACDGSGNVVNVCGDGLNYDFGTDTQPAAPAVNCSSPVTTDGQPGDACLDSCRFQGGCPFGYACAAIATLGSQSIGLCMGAGASEVGQGCAHHRDCAFGYCNGGTCTRDCSRDGLCPEGSSCTSASAPNVEGLPARICQ